MNLLIHRLYDKQQNESGVYIFGSDLNISEKNLQEKRIIENEIIDYASDKLFPNTPIKIFREMYSDGFTLLILKNLDEVPFDLINTEG